MPGVELPAAIREAVQERDARVVVNGTVSGGELTVTKAFFVDELGHRIDEADDDVPAGELEELVTGLFAENYPHDLGPGELNAQIDPDGEVRLQYYSHAHDELTHRLIHSPEQLEQAAAYARQEPAAPSVLPAAAGPRETLDEVKRIVREELSPEERNDLLEFLDPRRAA